MGYSIKQDVMKEYLSYRYYIFHTF